MDEQIEWCDICGFSADTHCTQCDAPLCRPCSSFNVGICDRCYEGDPLLDVIVAADLAVGNPSELAS